jgi:hypothetical protein
VTFLACRQKHRVSYSLDGPEVSGTEAVVASQTAWHETRAYLRSHQDELVVAARLVYPQALSVAGTSLITRPEWLPDAPRPLDRVRLEWRPDTAAPEVTGAGPTTARLRPMTTAPATFPTYADAVRELAAPVVFEDRATYRLLSADLAGDGLLSLGRGTYFGGINVGAAGAHEFAANHLRGDLGSPLRDQIGDPCQLGRRPANIAMSCLTLRVDAGTGAASFPLHWRDPAKVGHAGGLTQVVPVGIFQPISADPWNEVNDFSLWRCLIRECAEELLGRTEVYDAAAPGLDYANWEFARMMDAAKHDGRLQAWHLGLGVDPLTLATDLLVALVVESGTYDALFGEVVDFNAEGQIIAAPAGTDPGRVPFSEDSINHYTGQVLMQAAGAAVLRRAWEFREILLRPAVPG